MCAIIGVVVTLSLLYSLTFLDQAAHLFDALMLVALAAMCGFAMSGDVFNLFVWLELMGVAALLIAGLFLIAGIVHVREDTIDELRLRGRGGHLLGAGWLLGTLGLIGTPYVGIYVGHALVDEAGTQLGRPWVLALLWLGSALGGAALLRTGARIFLGWGAAVEPLLGEPMDEEPLEREVFGPVLAAIALVAVVAGAAISVVPGLAQRAEYAADRFRDRDAYAARVLHGTPVPRPPALPVTIRSTTLESLLYGACATVVAAALAGIWLQRQRLPGAVGAVADRTLAPPVHAIKALHSGVVGDYVTWVVVGTAVTGGVWALLLR